MGKLLFARKPTEEEKRILMKILKEGPHHIKVRAKIILLSGLYKYRISEISKIINLHPVNLRKWIHRFNAHGLLSIIESPAVGLKKKFDENFKNILLKIVTQPPRKLGLLFSHWTLHNLKEYLERKKVVAKISHETIRRILKEANINLKELRKKIELSSEY